MSVVCLFTYPFAAIKHETRQVHGASSNMARAVGHKSVVEETDLHQVLADGTRLNVIVVRLRDSAEEVHRVGVAKIVVECAKDESLSAEDLSFTETVVGDALEVLDVRRKDLLVLGRDEHGSDTH